MAVTEQLKSLVGQMPDPDFFGMYTENVDKEKVERAVAEMARGGRESMLGLIEMLGAPGTAEDCKPHYALHCMVNHALVARDEALRKELCEAMASQLANTKLLTQNRAYLCQELQWAGRDEACAALGAALLEDGLTDAAATALIAVGGERAAAPLRAAAETASGKSRIGVVDALAALGDPQSAAIFEQAMEDPDREVRLAAADGLSKLGLAQSADLLLGAAERCGHGWERTQLTKSCLVLAERLAAGGDKAAAASIYQRLQSTRTDDAESHVRHAAARGLAAIK